MEWGRENVGRPDAARENVGRMHTFTVTRAEAERLLPDVGRVLPACVGGRHVDLLLVAVDVENRTSTGMECETGS